MRPMNSSKNKLNSKISWVFNLEPNAHQVLLKKKKKKILCNECIYKTLSYAVYSYNVMQ